MEERPLQDDDIDFSMIGPGNDKPRELDFSLNDLLNNSKQQPENKQQNQTESAHQQNNAVDGSFMRDLGKLEQELSYETNPYDIYELSQQVNELASNGEGKQEQTCTRTINNLTKTVEKLQKVFDEDFKHLILDFGQDKGAELKIKQSFEDYFDASILKTKKININSVFYHNMEKPKRNDTLTSTSRKSILATQRLTHNKDPSSSKTKTNKSRSTSSMRKIQTMKKTPLKMTVSKDKISLKSEQKSKSKSNKKSLTNKLKIKTKQQNQVFSQYFGFEQRPIVKEKAKKKVNRSNSKGKKIIFSQKNVFISL